MRVERRLGISVFVQIAERTQRRVGCVRAQLAQFGCVVHADVDVLEHLVANLAAGKRPGDLDAFVQIARHQVRARKVHGAVVCGAEAVYAAVLEQTAHDRDHAHVLGCTLHMGNEAAYAADEQRNAHACVRGFGNLLDDFLVSHRVGFHERIRGFSSASELDLLVELLDERFLDLQGSHAQHFVAVRNVFQLHVAEEFHGILAERLIGRDEREIGVKPRRLFVVVAGSQLRDVLNAPIGRAARDAADLRMNLVVAEAVQHVASSLLEALRPFNVVVLVETGTQLEERRDFLAGIGCCDERLGKMRLARQAVKRDLYRDDIGVVGGFAQQLDERVHALVWIREQHVVLVNLVEDALLAVEARRPRGIERRVRKAGALLFGKMASQTPGEAEVERHDGVVHLEALQPQLLQHHLFHDGGKRTLAFQAHGSQASTLLQQALHVLAVILVLLVEALVGVDVGVARDADDVRVLDFVHAEDFGNEHLDGMFEQDELVPAARQLDDAFALVGKGDQAQHDAFRAALFLLALFLVLFLLLALGFACFVVEPHEDVQLTVLEVGERMARVDDLRRQERLDVVTHEAEQVVSLFV